MTITNGYCSLTEVRSWLRIEDGDDDAILELVVESASRLIDGYTGRRFYADTSATARAYETGWSDLATIDDVSSTSGLVVKTDDDGDWVYEITWASTDYRLEPANNLAQSAAAWKLRAIGTKRFPGRLQVTARWGWPAVPAAVKQACLIQAAREHRRRDSPFGVISAPDFGTAERLLAALDPDAKVLLDQYRLAPYGIEP